jgi:YidC/Oxa1 family membrane protein insertase
MMNNPRVFLYILLIFAGWLNYEAWMRDYSSPSGAPPGVEADARSNLPTEPAKDIGAAIPKPSASVADSSNTGDAASPSTAPVPAPATAGNAATSSTPTTDSSIATATFTKPIHVRTDVLDLEIDLVGGTIRRADLLRYARKKGEAERVRLMNTDPATRYLLQTGLTGPDPAARPTHVATFTSPQSEYKLEGGASELRVPLTWTDGKGVTVTKTFIFKPGQYRIDLEYDVDNRSGAAWEAAPYAQIQRRDPITKRSIFTTDVENLSFHGPAIRDGTKYQKLKTDSEDDRNLSVNVTSGGWIAALQHHFVSAVVPPDNTPYQFSLKADGPEYVLTAAGPTSSVANGQKASFTQRLFVGPKLQEQLDDTGTELDRVADYGVLTLLAKPLFIVLEWVHGVFGNWGWAIVFVTFLLKLLFYPLSETSGRSMAKMKLLGPRMKSLQETYKDDREKLGRAMMDLYKREKVNPVAGCLPMIIQIPVFLAFYWVLLESVEMRQAPFVGWINDLSSKDPFYVLPAIMAAAMFAQYKLQGTPSMDPVQQKVFMIMPFAMSIMFAFFPAGLVLYWVTNTLLSIAQQWNINRRIEKAKKKT